MSTVLNCLVVVPERHRNNKALRASIETAVDGVAEGRIRCVFESGELEEAIDRADAVLGAIRRADVTMMVVDGKDANLTLSLGMALALQKPILPIRACELGELPKSIAVRHWVEYPEGGDQSEFIHAVRSFLASAYQLCESGRPPRDRCVFICHRSTDKSRVEPVAASLQGFGYKVWYDSWSLKAGDGIVDGIHLGLERTTDFLIFMSAHTLESKWVSEELDTALTRAIERGTPRIVPVYLDVEAHAGAPIRIAKRKGVLFYQMSRAGAIDQLVDAIEMAS